MPAGQGNDQQRIDAAREELGHELALAAAFDRGRTDLSPDADATARMRARLFAAMAEMSPTSDAGSGAEPTAGHHPGAHRPGTDHPDADAVTTVLPVIAATPAPAPVAGPAAPQPSVGHVDHGAGRTGTARTLDRPTVDPTGDSAAGDPAAGVTRVRRNRHVLPRGHRDRPDPVAGSRRPGRPHSRRRIGIVAGAALFVMVLLTGGVLGSRGALPGDSLYGVKRAAESVGTVLTFGDEAKARRHLDLATTRLTEIEELAARHGGTSIDPTLYTAAIDEFDSAASEGSRMLLAGEDRTAGLDELSTWATRAQARWAALRSALPDPALPGAAESMALLDRLLDRAEALQTRADCTQVSSGTDELGPIPAVGACVPRPTDRSGTGNRSQSASAGTTSEQSNEGTESTTPTATPESAEIGPEGRLLPQLPTPPNPLDPATTTGEAADSTDTAATRPPGLLPPITLPPLIPGGKGITIGG